MKKHYAVYNVSIAPKQYDCLGDTLTNKKCYNEPRGLKIHSVEKLNSIFLLPNSLYQFFLSSWYNFTVFYIDGGTEWWHADFELSPGASKVTCLQYSNESHIFPLLLPERSSSEAI